MRVLRPEVVADDVSVVLEHPRPHGRPAALRPHLDPLLEDGGSLAELLGLVVVVHAELGEEDLVLVLGEAALQPRLNGQVK